MDIEYIKWAGFGLSFLAAFLFSLYHMTLQAISKISMSRFLENRDKQYRTKILEIYDELQISVEIIRSFFIVAFSVYLFIMFPRLKFWPLWLFLMLFAIHLTFFDLIPRFLSQLGRKQILSFFLPSIRFLCIFCEPLKFFTRRKSADAEPEEQREASEAEIRAFIEEAKEEGIIEKGEGVLIKSVVEFGDTIVREIMTPRVEIVCIRKDATIHKLQDLVVKEKHSRIPVYKDRIDSIEGIVIAKDLLEYTDESSRNSAIEPLIRPAYFVPESMKVSGLLKEFQKRKQKLAIVVDEHGGVSGLVTMEDLMEEIVGEIQDEYDKEPSQFEKQGPLDYIVSGDADVEDLEELFDLELAENDFITVGGLITHDLGRLPALGEQLEIKGLSMEVLDVDQKKIKKLRIQKKSENEQS